MFAVITKNSYEIYRKKSDAELKKLETRRRKRRREKGKDD